MLANTGFTGLDMSKCVKISQCSCSVPISTIAWKYYGNITNSMIFVHQPCQRTAFEIAGDRKAS